MTREKVLLNADSCENTSKNNFARTFSQEIIMGMSNGGSKDYNILSVYCGVLQLE